MCKNILPIRVYVCSNIVTLIINYCDYYNINESTYHQVLNMTAVLLSIVDIIYTHFSMNW